MFSFIYSYKTSAPFINYFLYVILLACSHKPHLQFLDVLLQLLKIKCQLFLCPTYKCRFSIFIITEIVELLSYIPIYFCANFLVMFGIIFAHFC